VSHQRLDGTPSTFAEREAVFPLAFILAEQLPRDLRPEPRAGAQHARTPFIGLYTSNSMSSRVVTFLLAVLTLWSCLAVTEQRFAEALELPEQTADLTADVKRSDLNGSMDDHVVDDQPAQPVGEPALDFAALIDSLGLTVICSTAQSARPPQPPDALWAAPYLAGLRRPPKSA
jgi:hypothetical protein